MMNDSTEVKQGDHKPRLTKLMQIHLVISLITGVLMLTSPSAAWAEFTLNLKDADLKHFIAKEVKLVNFWLKLLKDPKLMDKKILVK